MHVDICKTRSGTDKSDKVYILKICELVLILGNYHLLYSLISGTGENWNIQLLPLHFGLKVWN